MEDIFEELAAQISDEEDSRPQPRDDEAEEVNDDGTTRRVVKPPKRVVSRPRPKLDPARLLGPRGIFVLNSAFDGVKLKGKGHELDDLNNVLSRLQHWSHRLFPKLTFEDCIDKIEDLGTKKEIQTNMHKIRNGMIDLPAAAQDDADEVDTRIPSPDLMVDDAFDQLITAAAPLPQQSTLTEEQRARMMRNRLLAEERRQARRLARENELEAQRQITNQQSNHEGINNSVHKDSDVAIDPESHIGSSSAQLQVDNETNANHAALEFMRDSADDNLVATSEETQVHLDCTMDPPPSEGASLRCSDVTAYASPVVLATDQQIDSDDQ